MSHRALGALATLVASSILLVACGQNPTALPDSPSPSILDGAHDGNDNFYFLPPMAPKSRHSGTFDGSQSPEVQVCAWDGTTCAVTLAVFTTDAGYGSETIRVNGSDGHYVVNWHTGEILDEYPLAPGETYRVRVLLEGHELGHADLAVVTRARDARGVDRSEFIPVVDGRTLPIKFRIEEGAVTEGEISQPLVISAGLTHTCAVAADGQGYCWGANHRGQLGIGTAGGILTTPQPVTGGHTWRAIQTSRVFTCGLTTDDEMYCWGSNTFGELGIGSSDFATHPVPEPVTGGLSFQSLAELGDNQSSSACGVTTGGDMYCWGSNTRGEVGAGSASAHEATPRLVIGGNVFAGPAAVARRFACGLTMNGEVLCWGANDFGQLGRGMKSPFEATPAIVGGGHGFQSLAVGSIHACGIDGSMAAWCWGRNQDGELGLGSVGGDFPMPQLVSGGHAFLELSAGWAFVCGVDDAGNGQCWGQNQMGQLGRGFTSGDQSAPGLVVGGHAFETIDAGRQHACGVTSDGEVYCWGNGSVGQLGTGSTSSSPAPTLTMDLDPSS